MIKTKKNKTKKEKNVIVSSNVYAYIRVSTSKQDTEVQRYQIQSYADANNLVITEFVDEKVSGRVDIEDRDLNKIFKKAKCGDTIICTEVSRLARTMQGISKVLLICEEKGITVITLKENYHLDINNPTSKFIINVYAFTAETERNLISERTKEGLAMKKRMGIKLGRPVGAKNKKYILDKHKDKIERWIGKGVKKMEIARRLNVNVSTLYEFMKRNNIKI